MSEKELAHAKRGLNGAKELAIATRGLKAMEKVLEISKEELRLMREEDQDNE